RERVGGIGGHPDGRMRLLIRPRDYGGVLKAIELPLVAERLSLPRLPDDLQRLAKARLTLPIWNAEDVVGARSPAASDSQLEAAFAQVIDGGGLFGDAQRVVERQHVHSGADVHPLGAGGDSGGHRDGSGDDGP